MKKIISFFGLLLLMSSCKIAPQKIEYGKDICSFCDMAIVEKTHAAQYVTKKGRAYKFDAIECLIYELKNKPTEEFSFVLVTDYLKPGELIEANLAVYLISEDIKSPMGANLSAYSNKSSIKHEGNHYNWEEINRFLSKK
jgi:copper chaperone NosL